MKPLDFNTQDERAREREMLSKISKGEHLCVACEFCPSDSLGTTANPNTCEYACGLLRGNYRGYKYVVKPTADGRQVYSFDTSSICLVVKDIDGSGGYYVTQCDSYSRLKDTDIIRIRSFSHSVFQVIINMPKVFTSSFRVFALPRTVHYLSVHAVCKCLFRFFVLSIRYKAKAHRCDRKPYAPGHE